MNFDWFSQRDQFASPLPALVSPRWSSPVQIHSSHSASISLIVNCLSIKYQYHISVSISINTLFSISPFSTLDSRISTLDTRFILFLHPSSPIPRELNLKPIHFNSLPDLIIHHSSFIFLSYFLIPETLHLSSSQQAVAIPSTCIDPTSFVLRLSHARFWSVLPKFQFQPSEAISSRGIQKRAISAPLTLATDKEPHQTWNTHSTIANWKIGCWNQSLYWRGFLAYCRQGGQRLSIMVSFDHLTHSHS